MTLEIAASESIQIERIYFSAPGSTVDKTIRLQIDNQGATKMLENDASLNRTKQGDTKYHAVRDPVLRNKAVLEYCPTTEMVADILTKPIGANLLKTSVPKLALSKTQLQI